jgi:hypothetical protein
MREYRIIRAFVTLLLIVVAVYFFRRAGSPGAGEFDETAYARLDSACGYKPECKVNLGALFDGDWDTLWAFGRQTSQAELDAALPGAGLTARAGKRLIVLTAAGRVTQTLYEPASPETVLEHQVVFLGIEKDVHPPLCMKRNTWLWAARRAGAHGPYYVLSPDVR